MKMCSLLPLMLWPFTSSFGMASEVTPYNFPFSQFSNCSLDTELTNPAVNQFSFRDVGNSIEIYYGVPIMRDLDVMLRVSDFAAQPVSAYIVAGLKLTDTGNKTYAFDGNWLTASDGKRNISGNFVASQVEFTVKIKRVLEFQGNSSPDLLKLYEQLNESAARYYKCKRI